MRLAIRFLRLLIAPFVELKFIPNKIILDDFNLLIAPFVELKLGKDNENNRKQATFNRTICGIEISYLIAS